MCTSQEPIDLGFLVLRDEGEFDEIDAMVSTYPNANGNWKSNAVTAYYMGDQNAPSASNNWGVSTINVMTKGLLNADISSWSDGTKRSAKLPLVFAATVALALRVPADALAGRLRRAAVPRTVLASSCPAAALALDLALDLPPPPVLALLATSWQSSSSSEESESSRHTGSAAVPAASAVDADLLLLVSAAPPLLAAVEAAAEAIILAVAPLASRNRNSK